MLSADGHATPDLGDHSGLAAHILRPQRHAAQVRRVMDDVIDQAKEAIDSQVRSWMGAYEKLSFRGIATVGLILLILSLVALLVEQAWLWLMSGALQSVGLPSMSMHIVIIVIQVLLVWLATTGVRRGWLS